MTNGHKRTWAPDPDKGRVYELEVKLFGGPITGEFLKKNPVITRRIQILGSQTLARLHEAIFDAFDREEEHLYEFQVGGKGPMDPKARRYVLPMGAADPFEDRKPAGIAARTTIDDLQLEAGQTFGYWFDFGDDWWHQIDVIAIHDKAAGGKYPRVTAKVGASPPQYADGDEEEDE